MVWDVDGEVLDRAKAAGMVVAGSAAEIGVGAEVVFLCLPGPEAIDAAVWGPGGVLSSPEATPAVVDLGTSHYLWTRDFAGRLAERGLEFADAPVTGMERRAKDGDLTVMFGGEADLYARIEPILAPAAREVIHMGEVGAGQLTKLINQLLFNVSVAALAEVAPMAAGLGLDPERLERVINSGTGRSFASEFFLPRILEGCFDQGYPLEAAYKDMVCASELSARRQAPLPVVQAAMTTYQTALRLGLGDLDKGAMIQVFERLWGVEFRGGD